MGLRRAKIDCPACSKLEFRSSFSTGGQGHDSKQSTLEVPDNFIHYNPTIVKVSLD